MVPCISLYILQYRCLEAWSISSASDFPNTASPVLCLTPGTYGIPVPKHKPDVKVCQQQFNELCTLVREWSVKYYSFLNDLLIDELYTKISSCLVWFILCCFGLGKIRIHCSIDPNPNDIHWFQIQFLCCLVANYAHIKDGRKLRDYEEAIREEMETSKLNQG